MKRSILIILIALSWLPIVAQTAAKLNPGFYRICNVSDETDFLSINNDLFSYEVVIGNAGGGGNAVLTTDAGKARALECVRAYMKTDIHLVKDANCVNPATIVYLKQNGNGGKYDLIAQSTSLIELTTGSRDFSVPILGNVTVNFTDNYATIYNVGGSGNKIKYTAQIELKKTVLFYTADLGTHYFINDNGSFSTSTSNSDDKAKWYIQPVTSFNIDATSLVEYKGKYYCTMYTAFAYKLSGQTLTAWAITSINSDGTLTKEVVANNGGTVPAGTPVILECGSNEPGACTLEPQGEPRIDNASPYNGTNLLKGAYFCNTDGNLSYTTSSGTGTIAANNYTKYNASTMLVLGVSESPAGVNRLGFFPYSGDKMKSNKVWLEIPNSSANTNFIFDTDEPNQKGGTHE